MRLKWKGLLVSVTVALLAGSLLFAEGTVKLVNINTAEIGELVSLPRIGPSVAKRIIAYREENGGFERIEEIMNVRGIGQRTFDRLKALITVGEEEETNTDARRSEGTRQSP